MPNGTGVPLVEELSPAPDPAACCERLAGLPYRVFLDSAAPGGRLGRYSYLCADPAAVVRSAGGAAEVLGPAGGDARPAAGDALGAVRSLLAAHRAEPVPGLPPFQGGAAGYLAYEWGRTLERLPAPRFDDLGLPTSRSACTTGWWRGTTRPGARGWSPRVSPSWSRPRARAGRPSA
jgi:para-aminobenzoate synthetase component 1